MAKLSPKYRHGQIKCICVDKKADKINILIEKIMRIIRAMAALEVMITQHSRVVSSKKYMAEVTEKDYETMTWLHRVLEKMPEHCIVSCIVLSTKNMKAGYTWKHFYVLGLLHGSDNQKTSNVMDHAILSIVIAYSIINDCSYVAV